jgi:hypothetical protein
VVRTVRRVALVNVDVVVCGAYNQVPIICVSTKYLYASVEALRRARAVRSLASFFKWLPKPRNRITIPILRSHNRNMLVQIPPPRKKSTLN